MNASTFTIVTRIVEEGMDASTIRSSIDSSIEYFYESNNRTEKQTWVAIEYQVENALELVNFFGTFLKTFLVDGAFKIGLGIALGFIALTIDLLALAKESQEAYQFHQDKKKLIETLLSTREESLLPDEKPELLLNKIQKLEQDLVEQKEICFKSEVKVAYRVVYVVSSLLLSLSFICPALLLVGGGLFGAALLTEYLDKHNDYKLSRWFRAGWNRLFGDKDETNKQNINDCQKTKTTSRWNRFFSRKNRDDIVADNSSLRAAPSSS